MLSSVRPEPSPPLLAVDRTQFAPARCEGVVIGDPLLEVGLRDRLASFLAVAIQRPIGPDADIVFEQRLDVRAAGQEPQHLLDGGLPIDAFRCEDRHGAVGEIETRHCAEDRHCPHTGPVDAPVSMFEDLLQQIEILSFRMSHRSHVLKPSQVELVAADKTAIKLFAA